jgi:hypothetical protein
MKTRQTLNKHIASAPTLADKWEVAIHGGKPPSAIQKLPAQAFRINNPALSHGPEWNTKVMQQLKKKFVDLLLPALIKDDPRPFEELLEAMAYRRKTTVSLDEFIRRREKQKKKKPSKKEIGRKFRLALISLKPDDLLNINTVKEAIAKRESWESWEDDGKDKNVSFYHDDSALYATMKELNLRFLQPGDKARWTRDGKVIRTLEIMPDGSVKNSKMTRVQVEALSYYTCETNFPNGRAPQAG